MVRQIESSAIPLILIDEFILIACADFLLERGSGFFSAKAIKQKNKADISRKRVRTKNEFSLQRYRLPFIHLLS